MVLVANLPYNVATGLVLDLLASVPAIERMLVMVQREVGERLAAHVGDKAYGIPSVKLAYWATPRWWPGCRPPCSSRRPGGVRAGRDRPAAPSRRRRRPRPAVRPGGEGVRSAPQDAAAVAGWGGGRRHVRPAGVRPEARAEEVSLEGWAQLANADVGRWRP